MVDVLGVSAIVTKEMKQGRASGLTDDDSWRIADRNSEKYLKTLFGRRDVEDALGRLDRLTQEARMATVQFLKVAHHVKVGVETVCDKVNWLARVRSTCQLSTRAILNLFATRWQGNQTDDNGNKGTGATDSEHYGQ